MVAEDVVYDSTRVGYSVCASRHMPDGLWLRDVTCRTCSPVGVYPLSVFSLLTPKLHEVVFVFVGIARLFLVVSRVCQVLCWLCGHIHVPHLCFLGGKSNDSISVSCQ